MAIAKIYCIFYKKNVIKFTKVQPESIKAHIGLYVIELWQLKECIALISTL